MTMTIDRHCERSEAIQRNVIASRREPAKQSYNSARSSLRTKWSNLTLMYEVAAGTTSPRNDMIAASLRSSQWHFQPSLRGL